MAEDAHGNTVQAGRLADLQEVQSKHKLTHVLTVHSHIRVVLPTGMEVSLLFTDTEIKRANKRAQEHQEEIPKISWLRSIADMLG